MPHATSGGEIAPTTTGTALLPAVAALLAVLLPPPAAAQGTDEGGDFEPRSGFWLGGGLGGGVNDAGNGGGAGYLRLGGTLGPNLLLGGDAIAFTREEEVVGGDDVDVSRSNVTASLLWYLSERGDFFLKGGLGFARRELTQDQGDVTVSFEESGLGVTLGAGYDVQLGDGNLFLTPNADILLQATDGVEFLDSGLFLLTVGIGFR